LEQRNRHASDYGETILYGKNILSQKMTYNNGAFEKFEPETGLAFKSVPLSELYNAELFGQIRYLSDSTTLLKSLGISIFPLDNQFLSLTLGYKDKQQSGTNTRSLLSAGMSLNLGDISFDYAYDTTDIYQQENQHYFSLSLHFPVPEHAMVTYTETPPVLAQKEQTNIPITTPKEIPIRTVKEDTPVSVTHQVQVAPSQSQIPTPTPDPAAVADDRQNNSVAITGPVSSIQEILEETVTMTKDSEIALQTDTNDVIETSKITTHQSLNPVPITPPEVQQIIKSTVVPIVPSITPSTTQKEYSPTTVHTAITAVLDTIRSIFSWFWV
jgi:hypothetical protein